MDYKSIIAGCYQNGTLDLPATALGPGPAAQTLTQNTPDQRLKITGITKPDISDASAQFKGLGACLPFAGMDVTVQLDWTADRLDVLVTGTPKANWHLGVSFPSLATGLLPQLQFAPPTALVLRSAPAGEQPAGLSFSGTLQPGEGGLARYAFLATGLATVVLAGPITYANDVPRMTLAAPLGAGVALGFLATQPLELRLHVESEYNTRTKSYLSISYLEFATALEFATHTPQTTIHRLPLSATLHDPASDIQFDADVTALVDAAVDELASLLNGFSPKPLLPSDFQLENTVRLSDLNVQINPSETNKLRAVRLEVDTTRTWVLAQDATGKAILELKGVQVSFGIEAPFGRDNLFLGLNGQIGVGQNGVIELDMAYPGLSFEGTLKAETEIQLRELFTQILGYSSEAVPDLSVVDLEVSIQPGASYALAVELDGDWKLPVAGGKFAIKELALAVDYGKAQGLLARFEGVLGFDNQFIYLKADHPAADEGWTFAGGTVPGQVLEMANLMADLEHFFGVEFPAFLSEMQLKSLAVAYATKTSDLSLSVETLFPLENVKPPQWPDLNLAIQLSHVNGQYLKHFAGRLNLLGMQFDLAFNTGGDTTAFWGDYENTAGRELAVRDLLALLTTDADLLSITQGLQFNLKDAFVGYLKGAAVDAKAKWLLGLDMDFGADLTALPLVGKFIPKDEALRLAFQPRIATDEFTAGDITALKTLISGSAIALPETFAKGLTLNIELSLGTTVIPLALPIGLDKGKLVDQPKPPASPASSAPAPPDKVTWLKLQKSFGPLQLERVGVKYESGQLTFLLDGGFSVAGLTIALMGLSATTQLHPFKMSFGLDGLALDYKGAGFEISGAFLREELTDPAGKPYTAYNGAALIKAESFSLSAIGSYADYQGHPSMFIYAVLDSPLGGPAFFFVTGLAAGFGFNRALKIPGIDQIQNFPLVSRAVNGPTSDDGNIVAQMTLLNKYIPPAVGEYFLAVGIRFTTFKIIDSFALLIVSLGNSLEIDLLGLSTLVLPAQTEGVVPPLAEVQMALKASYLPAVGFLSVEAKLTPASFLFSHDCHLTGGFAFYTWFLGEHKDDFAVTLGGYHPSYQRPAHYPVVDKLGFNWALSSRLSIKGDAYFALVPSMVMAGTHLSAVWEDGNLRAWFNAGADFFLAWQPYHYDARLYVDMGVSYTYHFFGTHHISVDVGADLHIWGPEFAGTAEVHLWIVSFTVNFGNGGPQQPAPISWTKFRQSFLPDPAAVCSLAVKQGLENKPELKKEGQDKAAHPVLSPKGFVLSFDSVVPFKKASLKIGSKSAPLALDGGATNWGVGPMGLPAAAVASEAVVTITSSSGRPISASQLLVTPTTKGVPVALWGQSVSPALNGPRLVKGAVCGFDIRTVEPTAGQTAFIDSKKLEFELETAASPLWQWASVPGSEATAVEQQLNVPEKEADRRDYLRKHLETVQAERSELLRQLGITTPVFPDQSLAQAFVFAPQLV
ncbi:DUF6603 domain-containing protein [Hymenobacter monticola]|uniref:DUF6603 domain-containing protein n=1 Tax=Hymenobacter monticola TaxID=1705399 RepID=A0ABY4B7Y2_9BACT|nr:DUF6603 domain-containing protein [Hymenobacter monticola]UOE34974.1 hypothetical protein MTP16_04815 [Hymenobacter monticola]